MTVVNIDLEDGFPKISFNMKHTDVPRFMYFMEEMQQRQNEINTKREDIRNLVSALREIYAMRGEDGFIERVVNGVICNLSTIV